MAELRRTFILNLVLEIYEEIRLTVLLEVLTNKRYTKNYTTTAGVVLKYIYCFGKNKTKPGNTTKPFIVANLCNLRYCENKFVCTILTDLQTRFC